MFKNDPATGMPAFNRAFKASIKDDDATLNKREFKIFLENLQYFNTRMETFNGIAQKDERTLSEHEFAKSCLLLDLKLSPEELNEAFASMDEDYEGTILFRQFCTWIVNKQARLNLAPLSTLESGHDIAVLLTPPLPSHP